MPDEIDVLVVGAGNAGLCAALAAADAGARVTVLEAAPQHLRGGNTYFTGGGFRFPYDGIEDIRRLMPEMSDAEASGIDVGTYPARQMYDDMMRVSEGLADDALVDAVVNGAFPTMLWMRDRGVPWVLQHGRQAFEVAGIRRFWAGLISEAVGGGKGLSDRLFELAERAGVAVRYETKARSLRADASGHIVGVVARGPSGIEQIDARAVILACGGFEAN